MGSIQAPANLREWSAGWAAIARSRSWLFLLLATGSGSSIVHAHAPLVAFATVSGATLHRRKAVAIALAIWLMNQIYGYTLRQYPCTLDSFAWGLLMGLGTLLVAWLATIRPAFSRRHWTGHMLWTGVAAVGGFVLFEGMILLALPLIADSHSLSWGILLKLFVKETIWTGAIALCHGLLVRLAVKSAARRTSAKSPHLT